MKNKWLYILFSLFIVFSSCIKDELPNVEADIEDIMIPQMNAITSSRIDESRATVYLRKGMVDLENLQPSFVLSEGATIELDDSQLATTKNVLRQEYTVTSEDMKWKKSYTVQFLELEIPVFYDFERFTTDKWDEFYEQEKVEFDIDGNIEDTYIEQYIWASGNLGFSMVVSGGAKDFPTFAEKDASSGKGVACLKTRKTGSLGALQEMPIAAGNLFLGEFTSKGINIMKEPMKATHFGLPFRKKPLRMSVWFKYDGSNVNMSYDKDGNGTQWGDGRDYCAVYAVLYDNVKAKNLYGVSYLDGNTILKDDGDNPIIAIAGLHEQADNSDQYGTGGVYKHHVFDFKYREGKSVDPDRLKNYEYSLAIVFSSSFYGDHFIGGVGNILWIDDVKIECEEN